MACYLEDAVLQDHLSDVSVVRLSSGNRPVNVHVHQHIVAELNNIRSQNDQTNSIPQRVTKKFELTTFSGEFVGFGLKR